jgi:hypothetical protein
MHSLIEPQNHCESSLNANDQVPKLEDRLAAHPTRLQLLGIACIYLLLPNSHIQRVGNNESVRRCYSKVNIGRPFLTPTDFR